MHGMPEFVEEGPNLLGLQQTGLGGRWLGEIQDQGGSRVATRAIFSDIPLKYAVSRQGKMTTPGSMYETYVAEGEMPRMVVLPFTREEVNIEITEKFTSFLLVIP